MKKKRLRTYMGVVVSLLMIVTTVCCENQQQKDNIAENIDPIIVADDLAVTIGQWVSPREETEELFGEYSLDLFNEEGILKDVAIINSNREGLENFDFDKYSLVILRIVFADSGYSLDSLSMTEHSEKYSFNLDFARLSGAYAAITPFYYWRIYNKLENSYEKEIYVYIN